MVKKNKSMKTAIILDDKPDNDLSNLTNVLRKENFNIWDFQDPKELLNFLEEGMEYDVAIIDQELNHPKYDGLDIINILRKRNRKKAIICRSAQTSYKYKPPKADAMIQKNKIDLGIALDIINGCIKKYKKE